MGILEALSYGIPCIVTPGTNMADDLQNYNAGWMAEATSDSIAKTIKNAVSDYRNNVSKYRQNAIDHSKKFDWQEVTSKSLEVLNKFI